MKKKAVPRKPQENWMTQMLGAIDSFADARLKALQEMYPDEEKPKKPTKSKP